MIKLPKNPKPHYERGKKSGIIKSSKVDSKKAISELVKIIRKSRKIEEKFYKAKGYEAFLRQ